MARRLLPLLLLLAAPSPARAADPIMPLSEVRQGMQCTGLSVIRGTEISQFDVEVLDVIAAEPPLTGARILVRVSGPAVDATGIGPGFSGSPVYCPDGAGVQRNAGALSEAVGDYGNHVALATPIEEVLGDRPATPRQARRDRRVARSARPLAGPLMVSGLPRTARRLLTRAARRSGRAVLAAPGGPAGGYPPQELRPGSAVSASIASGDIGLGAVGTVAYRDGASIWAFGHALDAIGPRALFLQDAYVFGVISNPLAIPDLGIGTYKLTTSGGHDHGQITTDVSAAIAGTIGPEPASLPLSVVAREGGRAAMLDVRLADERKLGLGVGLSLVSPLAAGTAVERLVRSAQPVTLRMCTRFRTAERKRRLGWCNTYFGIDGALFDLSEAAFLVESFDTPILRVAETDVRLRVRRGVNQDLLLDGSARRRVRPGQRIRVRLLVQRRRGGRRRLTVRLPVPRSLRPGLRTLVIEGSGAGGVSLEEELAEALAGLFGAEGEGDGSERPPPRTVAQLERRIDELRRPSGIQARFRRRGARLVHRSSESLFEGRVRIPVVVSRRR